MFASLAEELVVFGPGDMRTAHSPRECVSLSELQEAVDCIKVMFRMNAALGAIEPAVRGMFGDPHV